MAMNLSSNSQNERKNENKIILDKTWHIVNPPRASSPPPILPTPGRILGKWCYMNFSPFIRPPRNRTKTKGQNRARIRVIIVSMKLNNIIYLVSCKPLMSLVLGSNPLIILSGKWTQWQEGAIKWVHIEPSIFTATAINWFKIERAKLSRREQINVLFSRLFPASFLFIIGLFKHQYNFYYKWCEKYSHHQVCGTGIRTLNLLDIRLLH